MGEHGYIYVATSSILGDGFCKVGQTTNPKERERQLNGSVTSRPIRIVKYVQVDDMDTVERAFHRILHKEMMKGEWFAVDVEHVKPMLDCVASSKQPLPDPIDPAKGRGGWHEKGWKMLCEGATQADVAREFGVTRSAVAAMKKNKMRAAGRGHEEENRVRLGTGTKPPQRVTPKASFRQPIIDVLERLGGRARAKDVLSSLEKEMNLSQADLKKLSNGLAVWSNNAHWVRQQLKEEGVLKRDSQWGWWELA